MQDQWQPVSYTGISFKIPSGWQQEDEETKFGLSEHERAWFLGDDMNPNKFLIIALGKNYLLIL